MSYPIDLSIMGKPSPRITHPGSAGKRRTPMNENRAKNQKSSVFGTEVNKSCFPIKSKITTKDGDLSAGIITRSQLDNLKVVTSRQLKEQQKCYANKLSPRKLAPDGVPQLALDDVIEPNEDLSYEKFLTKTPQLHSPTSKDTYSWGTPFNHCQAKGGGWQVHQSRKTTTQDSSSRKHEDVPCLDLKLSQTNEGLQQLRKTMQKMEDDVQIEYIGNKNNQEMIRKLGHDRKFGFMDDKIVSDELHQLKVDEAKSHSASVPFGVHKKFDSRKKRHDDLYRSSCNNVTELNLSKRLQFAARILSTNGQHARKEINGFFFVADQTLTMYEFRQFGTRSNALPFIQKDIYSHILGRRKGERYQLLDIAVGKDLTFISSEQASIPDSLKVKKVITFRITEVDEKAKQELLYDNCNSPAQRSEVDTNIKKYHHQDENAMNGLLREIRENVRKKLKSRGAKTMTNLHNYFIKIDQSGDGLLNKGEFMKALKEFRLDIGEQTFHSVWDIIDVNRDGYLDYGEFVRGFFGEISEDRSKWVRKAFSRIDPNKSGLGKMENLQKFYCASKHPDVIQGKSSQADILNDMLNIFQSSRHKKEISFSEFEAFYQGVSMGVESDQQFISLVRSTWMV